VARTFPLAQAAQAHAALEGGGMNGKVVLTT
jgi:NADPH:quinone reductase-like Zn-dependent oxidoreductase